SVRGQRAAPARRSVASPFPDSEPSAAAPLVERFRSEAGDASALASPPRCPALDVPAPAARPPIGRRASCPWDSTAAAGRCGPPLLHDGDKKSRAACDAISAKEGVRVTRPPIQAPSANAQVERWVGSVRRECLDRLLIVGRRRLDHVLGVYARHYNQRRPHRA